MHGKPSNSAKGKQRGKGAQCSVPCQCTLWGSCRSGYPPPLADWPVGCAAAAKFKATSRDKVLQVQFALPQKLGSELSVFHTAIEYLLDQLGGGFGT